ncbi:MAG: dihydroorotate dehydrogenase (quinone) [Chloroflexota bacterium]|nr:dihydroorotate dehydrogenase (quinone) [Chloroflexota bacterium]MDE2886360.1 dihydroorotate dehydrogenase (quinone) [Chloroflexota bacterium]
MRPLLFKLPPETAINASTRALSVRPLWRALGPYTDEVGLPASVGGVVLRNPVGLAAGLDKHCASLDSLAALGFGYVVGGTVTAQPRPGNPKPRVLRLTEQESIINALGFPGDGLDAALARLERLRRMPARVLVSIAALDAEETAECAVRLQPLVDGVEVNISSPNTAGLRRFQEPDALRGLLGMLNAVRLKPLFVKIPPWTNEQEREQVLALVRVCREEGVDAVTAANTVPVEDGRLATGRGGLSGRAILERMLAMLPDVRAELGSGVGLNACGGIASADDARAALEAGADTVQLYTGLVFRGPGLVEEICRGLRDRPPEGWR